MEHQGAGEATADSPGHAGPRCVARRRRIASVVATLALSAAGAGAAGAPRGTELTVFAGASLAELSADGAPRFPLILPAIYTFHTRLDAGALVGLRLTRYVTSRAAVEFDVAIVPSQDVEFRAEVICSPGFPCVRGPLCTGVGPCRLLAPDFLIRERLTTWHYGLTLTYDLAESDVRPYLGASFGAATSTGLEHNDTDVRLGLLAGVKLGSGKLSGRLEVLDSLSTSHFLTDQAEHDVQLRAGVTVRVR